jgi:hypothetical protein
MQSQFASSTSNPISFPDSSLAFQGGYAPSVPIFTLPACALETSIANAAIEDRKSLNMFFIFPSL